MNRGLDGFLPWRGSLMLDVVFLAMFLVIPVIAVTAFAMKGVFIARIVRWLSAVVALGLGTALIIPPVVSRSAGAAT